MNRTERHVPSDLLDLYFSELGKVRLLTAEDEIRLAKAIEAGRAAQERLDEGAADPEGELARLAQGGRDAADTFARANLRLVVNIAAKFSRRSTLGLDELIQEGNIGLLRAVEKFDWRKGFKFSTYATWWIRQAIQRGAAHAERTIRLPVAVHEGLVMIRAASARIESETGREATIAELAEATRMSEDKVLRALGGDHSVTSLDRTVSSDSDTELGSFVAVAADAPDEEVIERQFLSGMLATAEEHLDPRSWHVLQRRYGLDGLGGATLDAIGKDLGVSREAVRKIEKAALATLHEQLVA